MIIEEFLKHMKSVYQQFVDIEDKLTTVHNSTDEIIAQIEYVKMLLRDETIKADLDEQLEVVKSKKEFLDKLSLKLASDDLMKFFSSFMKSA